MKRILKATFLLLGYFTAFILLPTGLSPTEVMAGYQSTLSYTGTPSITLQQAQAIDKATDDKTEGVSGDPYVGTLHDMIVDFAIDVALRYGSNYYVSYNSKTSTVRMQDYKIHYSTNYNNVVNGSRGYSPFDRAINSFNAVAKGTSDYMYFSCHGSATFCWKYFWKDSPYYIGSTTVPEYIYNNNTGKPGPLSHPVSTIADLKAIAEPGDIVWNSGSNGGGFAHSQLWLGDIEFDDLNGTHVTMTDSKMNCGKTNDGNAWVVRPWYWESGKKYYVVKLDEVIQLVAVDGVVTYQNWINAEPPTGETGG